MLFQFSRSFGKLRQNLTNSPLPNLYRYVHNNIDDEVERKFRPNQQFLAILDKIAKSKRETTFTDNYFEFQASFELTTRDIWLRMRNNVIELKWPIQKEIQQETELQFIDFYHETTDTTVISKIIKELTHNKIQLRQPNSATNCMETSDQVVPWLSEAGLVRFASILTHRSRYNVELHADKETTPHSFYVDIDDVTYLDSKTDNHYQIGEVELIKAGGNSSPGEALKNIFAALNINPTTVRGKVLEFVHKFRPEHYQALENSGLIACKMGKQPPNTAAVHMIEPVLLPVPSENNWAERLLSKSAVNLHFSRRCNFECKFCFHTAKTSDVLPLKDLLFVVEELKRCGAEKINFAGGEPFLLPHRVLLGEMVKGAKIMGFPSTSIISNGSQSSCFPSWFEEYGQYLDILGISVDTLDPAVNVEHGRHAAGANSSRYLKTAREKNSHLAGVRAAADICKLYNIKFKINTATT